MAQRQDINQSSRLLQVHENDEVFKIIGHRCVTLSTTVADVYCGCEPEWRKEYSGVACMVKDNAKKGYFVKVVDLSGHFCLSFADIVEAQHFKTAIEDKMEVRQKLKMEWRQRRAQRTKPPPQLPPPPPIQQHGVRSTRNIDGTGPKELFDDPRWKKLLELCGVTPIQLSDEETCTFIIEFVEHHGGIEKAFQELETERNSVPFPSTHPPPSTGRSSGPPPPSSAEINSASTLTSSTLRNSGLPPPPLSWAEINGVSTPTSSTLRNSGPPRRRNRLPPPPSRTERNSVFSSTSSTWRNSGPPPPPPSTERNSVPPLSWAERNSVSSPTSSTWRNCEPRPPPPPPLPSILSTERNSGLPSILLTELREKLIKTAGQGNGPPPSSTGRNSVPRPSWTERNNASSSTSSTWRNSGPPPPPPSTGRNSVPPPSWAERNDVSSPTLSNRRNYVPPPLLLNEISSGPPPPSWTERNSVSSPTSSTLRSSGPPSPIVSTKRNIGPKRRNELRSWTVDNVCDWLKEIYLEQYCEMFRFHAIDGIELIEQNDGLLLDDLKIEPIGHRRKIKRSLSELLEEQPNEEENVEKDKDDEMPPDELLCPITQELMTDPVIVADGYTYERTSITQWFETGNNRSPMTNLPLKNKDLVPNRSLKDTINRYLDQ